MDRDLSKINLKPKNFDEALDVIRYLATMIIDLKKENESLREQLNNNSNNSSLPPSRYQKEKRKETKKLSQTWCQPGHKAFQRLTLSEEQGDEFIDWQCF